MYRQVDQHADPDGRQWEGRTARLEVVITLAVIVLLTIIVFVV